MTTQKNPNKALYNIGIVFLFVSIVIYCLPFFTPFHTDAYFGLFGINYLITVLYFIMLAIGKKLKTGGGGLPLIFLFLVLFHISAWSLNKTMNVFERSIEWFTVYLTISSIACLLLYFFDKMPLWARYVHSLVLGAAFSIFFYLSIYLVSLYPLSIPFALGLGLSLHSFVPLLFVLFLIRQFVRHGRINRIYTMLHITGAVLPLLVAIIFTISWNNLNSKVNDAFQQSLIDDNTDLPGWVRIAQSIPEGSLTEKYLKSDLVYSLPERLWSWRLPSGNFNEARKHDPLIMFAAVFSRPPAINKEERVKILESIYDARHKTLNRLWSGDHLVTQSVISNIRIWPESRIAYTEKTITILCDEPQKSWRNQREAIYTFHLPEGGVVTSLSLWIEGKEEKARLTTQSKADSAYNTIVGVQRRDPSVVHWQEGNTVSVRVFPILTGQNRVFKIGVTAPLTYSDGQLTYENIYFRGPDATDATEIIQVDWSGMPQDFKMPADFTVKGNNRYIKKSNSYNPDWRFKFKDPGITQGVFTFDNTSYTIQPYKSPTHTATFSKLYLDINKLWTKQEVNEILASVKAAEVYIHTDELVLLNDETWPIVEEQLKRNFSIFPFYKVGNREQSLVITKGSPSSPNLADLKKSNFGERLEKSLSNRDKFNVLCLSMKESPYIKALKEHRTLNFAHGDISKLKQYLQQNTFPYNNENDSMVVVETAGVALTKTIDKGMSNAPDHLMRLYAYNSVMQKLGTGIFTNREKDTALVYEAEQAYIVTPVSSLIVLETQADYDRFGIEKSKNSLENASLKSGGAVPEPEEWALIIIACCAILWTFYRNKFKKAEV